MSFFGKNGFVRKQEIAFARKLLIWKYEKAGSVLPDKAVLRAHAEIVVAQAHDIAQKSGKSTLEMMKQIVKDLKS